MFMLESVHLKKKFPPPHTTTTIVIILISHRSVFSFFNHGGTASVDIQNETLPLVFKTLKLAHYWITLNAILK